MRWVPVLAGRPGPKYRALAEALVQDVQSGALRPGTKLPTHRDLALALGVTIGTVSRGYAEVQRLGLITGEVGRGSFVGGDSGLGTLGERAESPLAQIDLSLNYPASAGIEDAAIRNALSTVAKRPLRGLLGYQHNGATPEQREAAAKWLGNGDLTPTPDQIILTCGAQHALAVALSSICDPGDTIATEALTYPGMRALSLMLGFRLKGIAVDEEGLIPEAFKTACESARIRALYTIPTLHNPTTATLPKARREKIIEVAREHDVVVIEDDVYGFLAPSRPPSMTKIAGDQVIYLTSVSKWIAAGMRVGFIVPPRKLVPKMSAVLRTTVWMAPPPMLECFRVMVESGDAMKVARARLAETRARQLIAVKSLKTFNYETHPNASHVWLKLPEPWLEQDFVGLARRRGLLLMAADAFAVTRNAGAGRIRLSLGSPETRADLARGMEILVDLLNDDPRLVGPYF